MATSLSGREILVGVTGGIAAFKTAALVSQLAQQGARVSVVMTETATQFVGEATFAALSGRPVYRELFGCPEFPLGPHIGLAERCQLMCVAPASADFLAKAALGLAGDLLSTLYLVFEGPVLIAPAMNTQMWNKPVVQRNVQQLERDGALLIAPSAGWLSCRQSGAGRMAEPDELLDSIGRQFH